MARVLIALVSAVTPMLAGDPVTVVPEPSTILLMGGGLLAFGFIASRRNHKK